MTPIEQVIAICGSQSEMARRVGGRTKTGHIYLWLRSRPPLDKCPAIETATGGQVRCDELRPDVEWQRDHDGRVVGYVTRFALPEHVVPAQQQAA